jgi:hypothetical protein
VKLVEGAAQPPLETIPLHSRPELPPDGKAEPGLRVGFVFARERIENEIARRNRAAVAVDRVEVARARKAMPALHNATRPRIGDEPFLRPTVACGPSNGGA